MAEAASSAVISSKLQKQNSASELGVLEVSRIQTPQDVGNHVCSLLEKIKVFKRRISINIFDPWGSRLIMNSNVSLRGQICT